MMKDCLNALPQVQLELKYDQPGLFVALDSRQTKNGLLRIEAELNILCGLL